MSHQAPRLTRLARRKAAMTRHHGPDHPRTRAAASELRLARLLHEIETALSEDERAELITALTA